MSKRGPAERDGAQWRTFFWAHARQLHAALGWMIVPPPRGHSQRRQGRADPPQDSGD